MAEPEKAKQKQSLALAKLAAQTGDACEMVRNLVDAGVLGGLVARIEREFWGRIGTGQVDDCVAEAVAAVYTAVKSGRNVADLVSYMLKTARNYANEHLNLRETPYEDNAPTRETVLDGDREMAETRRWTRRQEAIATARRLLPLIGGTNVQAVMSVVIDAVEKDIPHLSAADISDMTGINEVTVRQLMKRGLERLTARAKDEGMHLERYQVFEIELSYDRTRLGRTEQDEE